MITVTHRFYDQKIGLYQFEALPQTFGTYKEAIEYYHGTQDWYDKKMHRFIGQDGDLYQMNKQ